MIQAVVMVATALMIVIAVGAMNGLVYATSDRIESMPFLDCRAEGLLLLLLLLFYLLLLLLLAPWQSSLELIAWKMRET